MTGRSYNKSYVLQLVTVGKKAKIAHSSARKWHNSSEIHCRQPTENNILIANKSRTLA